jgi:hypothetical protein
MKHIPGGHAIERSLKDALQELRIAIKQINEYAAKLIEKCDYSGAEGLISKAKVVEQFETEMVDVIRRWREIKRGSKEGTKPKEKKMPLWNYYVPTLKVLIELGGTARSEAIIEQMESENQEIIVENGSGAKYIPQGGKYIIRHVLRAMEKERFVQRDGKEWRITTTGRKASAADLKVVS